MFDSEVKIGEICMFAMTSGWSEVNYGNIVGVSKDEDGINVYDIYNPDEDKHYHRKAGWIRQMEV